MGMDKGFSMLKELGDDSAEPMNLRSMPLDRLSNISFLYGGVGDARYATTMSNVLFEFTTFFRHVYTTLIDLHLHHTSQKLSKEKKDALFVHITMNDVHPAMLARDMILLMLASQLGDEGLEPEDLLELKATLVYFWNGLAMPSYCADR